MNVELKKELLDKLTKKINLLNESIEIKKIVKEIKAESKIDLQKFLQLPADKKDKLCKTPEMKEISNKIKKLKRLSEFDYNDFVNYINYVSQYLAVNDFQGNRAKKNQDDYSDDLKKILNGLLSSFEAKLRYLDSDIDIFEKMIKFKDGYEKEDFEEIDDISFCIQVLDSLNISEDKKLNALREIIVNKMKKTNKMVIVKDEELIKTEKHIDEIYKLNDMEASSNDNNPQEKVDIEEQLEIDELDIVEELNVDDSITRELDTNTKSVESMDKNKLLEQLRIEDQKIIKKLQNDYNEIFDKIDLTESELNSFNAYIYACDAEALENTNSLINILNELYTKNKMVLFSDVRKYYAFIYTYIKKLIDELYEVLSMEVSENDKLEKNNMIDEIIDKIKLISNSAFSFVYGDDLEQKNDKNHYAIDGEIEKNMDRLMFFETESGDIPFEKGYESLDENQKRNIRLFLNKIVENKSMPSQIKNGNLLSTIQDNAAIFFVKKNNKYIIIDVCSSGKYRTNAKNFPQKYDEKTIDNFINSMFDSEEMLHKILSDSKKVFDSINGMGGDRK